ncbi:MAG: hypothetical protein ABL883_04470 [Terricaulis sp.]
MRTLIAAAASFALFAATPAFADEVRDALEAYALYQSDVSALLDSEIASARAVDAALARLQHHNPRNVARGWIAYGALTAAQSPDFAAGIARVADESGRAPFLAQLRGDLTFARRGPRGSSDAIQFILNAASADGARVAMAGARYERFARSPAPRQHASAGESTGANIRLSAEMQGRLRVTAVSARPMIDISDFGGRGFWDAMAGRDANAPRGRHRRENTPYAAVTDHMLTLGALVVTESTGRERRRVSALLNEPLTQYCLAMERQQLRQCVGVSVDASERAYCLARHGLSGPGGCFSAIAR